MRKERDTMGSVRVCECVACVNVWLCVLNHIYLFQNGIQPLLLRPVPICRSRRVLVQCGVQHYTKYAAHPLCVSECVSACYVMWDVCECQCGMRACVLMWSEVFNIQCEFQRRCLSMECVCMFFPKMYVWRVHVYAPKWRVRACGYQVHVCVCAHACHVCTRKRNSHRQNVYGTLQLNPPWVCCQCHGCLVVYVHCVRVSKRDSETESLFVPFYHLSPSCVCVSIYLWHSPHKQISSIDGSTLFITRLKSSTCLSYNTGSLIYEYLCLFRVSVGHVRGVCWECEHVEGRGRGRRGRRGRGKGRGGK